MSRGRARTLMEAIERVEARGGERPQMNILGRAGVIPWNWVGTHGEVRTTCEGREVGQLGPNPGGLSRRRWGQSFVINTPILSNTSNNPPVERGRGKALSASSPLEDQPPAERCHDGPLRCPRTMCLSLAPWLIPQSTSVYFL